MDDAERGSAEAEEESRLHVPEWSDLKSLADSALRTFGWNFLLAYNIRAGVSVVLRAIGLLRTRPASLLSLSKLLSERHVVVREEAVRIGLFVAGTTATYRFVSSLLAMTRQRNDGLNDFLGGCTAGLFASVLDADR